MATSRISICNMALSRVMANPIQSLEETSLEARECRRWYPMVLSALLEGPHDWSAANRRTQLAETANDRSAEWTHAYAIPADLGSAIRVLPDLEAIGLSIPVPLEGDPYAERWAGYPEGVELPYVIASGTLYTNASMAVLEYASSSIEEARVGPMLAAAISLELAAHLALAVKQDRKLRAEILVEAEVARERAMADDLNRQPQRYAEYRSEALASRG